MKNKGRRTWSPYKSNVSGLQGPKEQERSLLFVSLFLGLNMEEYSMVWREERGLGMKAGLAGVSPTISLWMRGPFLRLPAFPFSFLQPVGDNNTLRGLWGNYARNL